MQTIPKKEGKGVTLYELVYIMSVAALVTSGRKRGFICQTSISVFDIHFLFSFWHYSLCILSILKLYMKLSSKSLNQYCINQGPIFTTYIKKGSPNSTSPRVLSLISINCLWHCPGVSSLFNVCVTRELKSDLPWLFLAVYLITLPPC